MVDWIINAFLYAFVAYCSWMAGSSYLQLRRDRAALTRKDSR